ncbi:hypothetical protein Dimus_000292 [Dionaea muscipula]
MDPHHSAQRPASGGDAENWTNEKHLNFLSVMEATFVQTMLIGNGDDGGGAVSAACRPVRLDRYVPDISESTVDLKEIGRSHGSGSDLTSAAADVSGRRRRRRRRKRGVQSNSSTTSQDQDQVNLLTKLSLSPLV